MRDVCRVPESTSLVELRRACLQLVLSLVCVPSGLKSLVVPSLLPPSAVVGIGGVAVGVGAEVSQAAGGVAGGPPKGGAVAALFGVAPPQRSTGPQVVTASSAAQQQQQPLRTFEDYRLQIFSMLINALNTETQTQQPNSPFPNHYNMQMILCRLLCCVYDYCIVYMYSTNAIFIILHLNFICCQTCV